MDNNFLTSYFRDLSQLIEPDQITLEKLILLKKKMVEVHKNGKKTLIFGNGGSAAVVSHILTDFINVNKLNARTLHESSLLSCMSNDYGYECDLVLDEELTVGLIEKLRDHFEEEHGLDYTIEAVTQMITNRGHSLESIKK